jgi:N,N'-diacetyllegionaminate synthase
MELLDLNGHIVGPGHPPYIIAEIGSNHNGDMDLCRRLVDAATECGADAVKFQSWSRETLIGKAEYARNTSYLDTHRHFGSLEEMVVKYQFTPDQHMDIAAYCKSAGITFLSSPFSPGEVDLLESLDVPCFKIASMDVNNLPFLEYVGNKGKPVLLSTGMATLGETERALACLRENGSGLVALLHCVSIYPPAYGDIHLRNMATLERAFDVPVGFSDHTIGSAIPLAAIALGSCVIEKHFTLDKTMEGWDHWISADPMELKTIVDEGRNVFEALGSSFRTVSPAEMEKRSKFRRRAVLKRSLKKGETIGAADIDFKRPGNGINPDEIAYIVGRKVIQAMNEGDELEWSCLS